MKNIVRAVALLGSLSISAVAFAQETTPAPATTAAQPEAAKPAKSAKHHKRHHRAHKTDTAKAADGTAKKPAHHRRHHRAHGQARPAKPTAK
jgi:hypothetical protein